MPNHFLAAGVYGCVYYPGYTCKGNAMKKKNWVSKITDKSDKTESEIEVGKRLKKVPHYEEHFGLVERDCTIPYKNVNTMKEGCELLKKEKSYILLYSRFIPSIELYKYLQDNSLFIRVFRTYYQLCEKIAILVDNGIVHHDFHFANIIYSTETAKLYIIDFGLAMLTDRFQDITYLRSIFSRYMPEWNWYSLEIHFITYILQHGELTHAIVKQAIDTYLANHVVFKQIPILEHHFKKEAFHFFSKLVDQDPQETLVYLLSFWNTWDYYECGLRFLHLYMENKVAFPAYYEQLIQLINANPEKRPTSLQIRNANQKVIQAFDLSITQSTYFSIDASVSTESIKKIDWK